MTLKALRIVTCCLLAVALAACTRKPQLAETGEPAEVIVNYQLSEKRGRAAHVVIMVWDGMRPDFVTEENTPTLWQISRRGVTFSNHHPAYPSTTEVNGTALATGTLPARSGIIGNREFRPAIDPRKPIATEAVEAVRKGDVLTGGKYLAVPTLAETIQQAGFRTAIAGTKPVALLWDRAEKRAAGAARKSVTVFQGQTAPVSAASALMNGQGDFPEGAGFPNAGQDRWTTKVLTEELWKEDVPKFSVLWVSEPDYSQHFSAPGAPLALKALRSSDEMLAMVIAALTDKGVLEKTDIFVVSDHGFSTIQDGLDIAQELTRAGFRAARQFNAPPQPGDILVGNSGATLFFYVTGHDRATTQRLVTFLQQSPLSGVIFTRETLEGTFPLSAIHIDSPDAPDVVLSPRWNDGRNASAAPGMIAADGLRNAGHGMHGSLSPFDMRNTLIAAGPDFPAGVSHELPTGNIDLAPTVLWILGIRPTSPFDGRVLGEALNETPDATAAKPEETLMEVKREGEGMKWHQHLRRVQFGNATYFLEGNGGQAPQ
jgi:arylsulfatase A-like enzyme